MSHMKALKVNRKVFEWDILGNIRCVACSQKYKLAAYISTYIFKCVSECTVVNMKASNATQIFVGQVPYPHFTSSQMQASSASIVARKEAAKID